MKSLFEPQFEWTEARRIAWTRFCNGLKIDGPQRAAIIRMFAELNEDKRLAEQRQWNAEHYLELSKRMVRHRILMGYDDGSEND